MTNDKPPGIGAPPSALSPGPAGVSRSSSELMSRIVSGSVLAGLGLALTVYGVVSFAVLVTVVALIMSWEWARVVRGTGLDVAFWIQAISVVGAVALTAAGYAVMGAVVIALGSIVVLPLRVGADGWMSVLGVAYVGFPAITLVWLRSGIAPYGLYAVLFVFLVVWTTDIAAFAFGRSLGGPKLAPSISPGKTWSGFVGGVATAAVAAALVGAFALHTGPLRLGLVALLLALVAQAGDLAESALKRRFKVKDSSALIPGHGGFLDRMDSIVPVSVIAALIGLAIDWREPARALLLGH